MRTTNPLKTSQALQGPNLVITTLLGQVEQLPGGFDREQAVGRLAKYVETSGDRVDWGALGDRLSSVGIAPTPVAGGVRYGEASHHGATHRPLPSTSAIWGQAMRRDLDEAAQLPKWAAAAQAQLTSILDRLAALPADDRRDAYRALVDACNQAGIRVVSSMGVGTDGVAPHNDVGLTWLNTRLMALGLPAIEFAEDPALEARRLRMRPGDLHGDHATISFSLRTLSADDLAVMNRYGVGSGVTGLWNVTLEGEEAKNARPSGKPGSSTFEVKTFKDSVQSTSIAESIDVLRDWMKRDRPAPAGFHLVIDLWNVPEDRHDEAKAALGRLGAELGVPLRYLEARTAKMMDNAKMSSAFSARAEAFIEKVRKQKGVLTEEDRREQASLAAMRVELAEGLYER